MFKVSFKENAKKIQIFNNKATVVTLTGRVKMPKWFCFMPSNLAYWIGHHPTVEFDGVYALDEAIVTTSGKSICSENDTFDSVLGERIAESRAKIKLYRFMHDLCKKLMYYYYGILYGVPEGKGEVETKVIKYYKGGLQEACSKYTSLWVKESKHLSELLNQA